METDASSLGMTRLCHPDEGRIFDGERQGNKYRTDASSLGMT